MKTQNITSEDLLVLLDSEIRDVIEISQENIFYKSKVYKIDFIEFLIDIEIIPIVKTDDNLFRFTLFSKIDDIYPSDERWNIANELVAKCAAFAYKRQLEMQEAGKNVFKDGIKRLIVLNKLRKLSWLDRNRAVKNV